MKIAGLSNVRFELAAKRECDMSLSFTKRSLFILLSIVTMNSDCLAQEPVKPATLPKLFEIIDWSHFPKPNDAISESTNVPYLYSFTSSLTYSQAADFYRRNLPPLGWLEDKKSLPNEPKPQLFLSFEKSGYWLTISGWSKGRDSGKISLIVRNEGNIDARTLPRLSDAKMKYEYRDFIGYGTSADPTEIVKFYQDVLPKQGWKGGIYQFQPGTYVPAVQKVLKYRQNAIHLHITISVDDQGLILVGCGTKVGEQSPGPGILFDPEQVKMLATQEESFATLDLRRLPQLENAEKRSYSDAIAKSSLVEYQAPGTVKGTSSLYQTWFIKNGWTESLNYVDENRAGFQFEKNGLLVSLSIGRDRNKVNVNIKNHGSFDLRALPYPDGVELGAARSFFVECKSTLTPKATCEFYQKELPKSGWKQVDYKEAFSGDRKILRFEQRDKKLVFIIEPYRRQQMAVPYTSIIVSTGMKDD